MDRSRIWPRVLITMIVAVVLWAFWQYRPSSQNPSVTAHFLHGVVFGWINFIERVLPDVRVALGPVAFTLLVWGTTWGLLYAGGRRWWGWSWRMPFALVCAPAVLFAIVLASAGIQTRVTEIAPELRVHPRMPRLRMPPEIRETKASDAGEDDLRDNHPRWAED